MRRHSATRWQASVRVLTERTCSAVQQVNFCACADEIWLRKTRRCGRRVCHGAYCGSWALINLNAYNVHAGSSRVPYHKIVPGQPRLNIRLMYHACWFPCASRRVGYSLRQKPNSALPPPTHRSVFATLCARDWDLGSGVDGQYLKPFHDTLMWRTDSLHVFVCFCHFNMRLDCSEQLGSVEPIGVAAAHTIEVVVHYARKPMGFLR
jgi:hypothetical protein